MQNEEKREMTADPQHTDTKDSMSQHDALRTVPIKKDTEDKTIHSDLGAIAAISPKHSLIQISQMDTTLRRHVYNLAKRWIQMLAIIASIIFANVITVILGFGNWTPEQIRKFVQAHPTASIVIVGLFALITILAWLYTRGPAPRKHKATHKSRYNHRLFFATITSTVSIVFIAVLSAAILIRPPWCPDFICQIAFSPPGPHDDHLEVPMALLQSEWYVIPDSPVNFSLRNLPTSIGAQSIDGPKSSFANGIVLEIRNWQQSGYGVIIEKVNLVIDKIPETPYPLNVWNKGLPREYGYLPFQVMYRGQLPGAILPVYYTRAASDQIVLNPEESDTLLIRVISNVAVDLQFHLQIIYHIPKESQPHTLNLNNNMFELIFSYELDKNKKNWHPYQLLPSGRFVPSS